MAKADITLRGRRYSIACAPGQEDRVTALSKLLENRVENIAHAVGDIGEERLLLLASLALLDELDDVRKMDPVSVRTEERCAKALADAARRIEKLAARIDGGQ